MFYKKFIKLASIVRVTKIFIDIILMIRYYSYA